MIKKILITFFLYSILTISAFAAGSDGGDEKTKVKSNYDKAVAHVKAAKNYEEKVAEL